MGEPSQSGQRRPFSAFAFLPHTFIQLMAFGPRGEPMVEAYCVKCKAKREMKNPQAVTLKNGKPATKGTCPVCGTAIMRIGAAK